MSVNATEKRPPTNCSSETRACARKSNANRKCRSVRRPTRQNSSHACVGAAAMMVACIEICSAPRARASARKRRARMSFPTNVPHLHWKRPRTKTFRFFWTARAGVKMKLIVPTWNTKSVWPAMDPRRSAQKNAKM